MSRAHTYTYTHIHTHTHTYTHIYTHIHTHTQYENSIFFRYSSKKIMTKLCSTFIQFGIGIFIQTLLFVQFVHNRLSIEVLIRYSQYFNRLLFNNANVFQLEKFERFQLSIGCFSKKFFFYSIEIIPKGPVKQWSACC